MWVLAIHLGECPEKRLIVEFLRWVVSRLMQDWLMAVLAALAIMVVEEVA